MSSALADVRPLVVLGAARREELRRRLSVCVGTWRDQWSAARDAIEIVLGSRSEASVTAVHGGGAMTGSSESQGSLFRLRWPAGFMASLLGAGSHQTDFGAADASRGVGAEVKRRAMRQLCEQVLTQAGVRDPHIEQCSETRSSAAYVATAAVHINARSAFHIDMSAECVLALTAGLAARLPQGRLERRNHAIGPEVVRVRAVLGDAQISLEDLARLQEGDVVVLDALLSDAVRLSTEDGRGFASAALGARDGRRAVRLDAAINDTTTRG